MSPATRLVAKLLKATKRPSAEMLGVVLSESPWTPVRPTLMRSVVPATRSRTNTSGTPLVSKGTRSLAQLVNAT